MEWRSVRLMIREVKPFVLDRGRSGQVRLVQRTVGFRFSKVYAQDTLSGNVRRGVLNDIQGSSTSVADIWKPRSTS